LWSKCIGKKQKSSQNLKLALKMITLETKNEEQKKEMYLLERLFQLTSSLISHLAILS